MAARLRRLRMDGDEPMTRDMLRWLYTALTRATDKLYLVNFDERFYE